MIFLLLSFKKISQFYASIPEAMKSLHLFIVFACLTCFFSCGSKKSDPQSPIVAKWTLQQEHVVVTVDNTTTLDTMLTSGGATHGMAQFNSNGSYSSSAGYDPGNTSLSNKVPASSQSNTGTYSYSGTAFSIQPGLAGWYSYVTGSSTTPVTNSSTIQVTSLTPSALNVHTSINFSVTYSPGTHTISQVCDFYYTK